MTILEAKIDAIERRQGWLILMSAISVILGLAKLYIQTSASTPPASQNSNSVNIGAQSAAAPTPQRDYLTTEDLATREGVSPRTVITWIEGGRIQPPPSRAGRAWTISPDYRLQPLLTAENR